MVMAQEIVRRFVALPLEKRRLYLQKMLEGGVSPATLPIPPLRGDRAEAPLSYAQERQWFLWQMEPDSAAWHIVTALRLRGVLDIDILERSFNALIARHESLRTTFAQDENGARQVIQTRANVDLTVRELNENGDEETRRACISEFIDNESRRAFDLQTGPLLRVSLLRCAADEHVLVLTQHHIVADGWSMAVMVEELASCYAAFCRGETVSLPPLPIQYADYAIWQRSWLEAGESERQLTYWRAQLDGEQAPLTLPFDHPRPPVSSYRGARLDYVLPDALYQALQTLARREQATLFTVLLAAFQCLLYRYSGQGEIRVGVPSANRNRVETEGLIGFFVNTQVLKADIDGCESFATLLRQVKETAAQAQAHQELPFEQLVEALRPDRSLNHHPLFQVLFNHQRADRREQSANSFAGLRTEPLAQDTHAAPFDLSLEVFESGEDLRASFVFATDLFEPATIDRLAGHWLNLLRGIIDDPQRRIGELPLLDQNELRATWEAESRTRAPFPERCVHEIFETRAAATPDAIALVFDGLALSYAELNTRANRLAHRLIEQGVDCEVRVGIAVERSIELVVGLLAILKAGGAYVPLDPDYPPERLAYLMQDSGIALLLTQPRLQPKLSAFVPAGSDIKTLLLVPDETVSGDYTAVNPQRAIGPRQLCYLIYTSGSTGKPKGVMVRHAALTNFIHSMAREPGLQPTDRLLSLTTFAFDIFGLEIYLPLCVGARIVLANRELAQDPLRALALVEREGITAVQATPAIWRAMLESGQAAPLKTCKLLCGGEALPDDLAARLSAGGREAWNLYGPTETTIWSALQRIETTTRPALGTAIANTTLFVLDAQLAPLPDGVAGELLIGGEGLARGYHQRPALTAERFVPNPFAADGSRLYRTGDLARHGRDAGLEYIGRIDHQVKVHGFRIELGEIETALRENALVREALVLAQEVLGGRQLVAYIVPRDNAVPADPDAQNALRAALRAALGASLPAYMVPALWLWLERFPLTPNGKVDRRALPLPDAQKQHHLYTPPRDDLERDIAAIWQAVLKLERVGLGDHFFDLGGHSLLAMQVTVRLREQLRLDVPVKSLFLAPTLDEFCESVRAALSTTSSVQDALGKSLDALKRLSADEIEKLIS